jgi:hypothetical protein
MRLPIPDRKYAGLRVLYLTESFFPPYIGGLEKHAYQLSCRLVSKGLGLSVITRKAEPEALEIERFGGLIVKRISPSGVLKGKGWKAIIPLLSLLIRTAYLLIKERKNYDLLLVSGAKVLSIPAVLVSKSIRKHCVIKVESPVELREDISKESLEKMKIPGVEWFTRWGSNLLGRRGWVRRIRSAGPCQPGVCSPGRVPA